MPPNWHTQLFLKDPLDFMRRYSVTPPDGIEALQTFYTDENGVRRVNSDVGVGARQSVATDGMFSRFFNPGSTVPNGDYSVSGVTCPIGWIKFEKPNAPGLAGAFTFSVKREKADDRIPIWFLPWQSHSIVEMTIPPSSGLNESESDPAIFFTAAINGCSVFAQGDPRSPRLGHGGISQGQTPYGNNPSDFWRHLLHAHLASEGRTGRIGEVNNTDYVNQTGQTGGSGTANSLLYKQWLQNLPPNGLNVEAVLPWGAVFGIRYGSMWSFYLQENATIKRYTIRRETQQVTYQRLVQKKKLFGGYTNKMKEVTRDAEVEIRDHSFVNKPMLVRPFFPQGDGRGDFRPNFKRV